jgi:hypothetical protein
MIYNTLNIKLTIEQQKKKRGFNSGAPEELAVPYNVLLHGALF